MRILICLQCDLTKYLKTFVLVKGALKFSVHHGNTAFQIGVIQAGALKMQIPTGVIKVKLKKKSFKRTDLIIPWKLVNEVSKKLRLKGKKDSRKV